MHDLRQLSLSRIFLRELENYLDCPELVGRCFLERVCLSNTHLATPSFLK